MKTAICFDLETFRFAPGNMSPRPVCCTWSMEGSAGLEHMGERKSWEMIEEWIDAAAAGEVVLVGQHVCYDVGCLLANCDDPLRWGRKIFAAYEADGIEDTATRQKLLDIEAGCYRGFYNGADGKPHKITYHLGDMVPRLLGHPMAKPNDVRTSFGELYNVSLGNWPQEHIKYALLDATELETLWRIQEKRATEKPGILYDQHRQTRASFALQLASNWGLICDESSVRVIEEKAKKRCMELSLLLRKEGLMRSNGTKIVAAAQHRMEEVCRKAGIDIPLTDGEGTCVDGDACLASGDTVLLAWAEFNRQQNILSKDIPMLREGCGRPIHSYFEECVESGRTSSSKPNVQNIKRTGGFRECFIPRSGHLYLACDYGKAELHSLAEVCYQLFGHSALGDALRTGVDPHLKIAGERLGISYEEVMRLKNEKVVKDARQAAKAINFGLPGGLGAKKFMEHAKNDYGIVLSFEQAQRDIEVWKRTWPEVKDYLEWVARAVGQSETKITQLFSGRMRGGCGYTDGANTLFQGLTADYAKAAMWNVAKEQYTDPDSPLWGCRTVNMVHDELLVEVPDDIDLADAAATKLQDVMEKTAEPWTPHCPVKAEPVLMRRWSKKAQPVRDEAGRLTPWDGQC